MDMTKVASNGLEVAGAGLVLFGLWSVFPALALMVGGGVLFILGKRIG